MQLSDVIHTFSSDKVQAQAAEFIAQELKVALEHSPILLLLSGGSAIAMYRQLFQNLVALQPDLHRLTVSMFDERFGPAGHADSNETQLTAAGILNTLQTAGAGWVSYLATTNPNGTLETVGESISKSLTATLTEALATHQLWILAGIGDDGHTAGLLPTADTLTIDRVFHSPRLVEAYQLPADTVNPFRERLTCTPTLISQASTVFAYATGPKKIPALRRFLAQTEPVPSCPALSLWAAERVRVLTDCPVSEIAVS